MICKSEGRVLPELSLRLSGRRVPHVCVCRERRRIPYVGKGGNKSLHMSGRGIPKVYICREGGYQKFTYVGDLRYQKSRFSFISWEGWATKSFHISGGMWMVTKV